MKLGEKIPLLDHGYIQYIEHYGSDERIIEAARMSTGKGFLGWGPTHAPNCGYVGMPDDPQRSCTCGGKTTPGDEKLLRFLYENKHATPFEMAGIVIEVQAPIFVFREWHRHRTQSYNEMSARYTPLPDVNYVPTIDRLLVNSKTDKQAGTLKGSEELTEEGAAAFQEFVRIQYASAEVGYQHALKIGVPKELARVHLPVGRYSRMRASANLRNWMAFMTLRSAEAAQWEIRQYSLTLGSEIIHPLFPRTWELFQGSL